jgi:hypothetical protein
MKARFDYLKPKAVIDLKTFANQMNKPIDRAIYGAMAGNKYHIQATFYLHAVARAQELARAGHLFGTTSEEWLQAFLECEEHDFFFVFQQKGVAPLARGKKFPRGMVHGAGLASIEQAKQLYKDCVERFGTDPWLDMAPIDSFDDSEFPAYATEI